LINKYQKHVCVNRLEETYSKISHVITLAQRSEAQDPDGQVLQEMLESSDITQSNLEPVKYFVENYIKPYMVTSKIIEGKSLLTLGYPLYKDLANSVDTDAQYYSSSPNHVIVNLANGVVMDIRMGGVGKTLEVPSGISIIIGVDINGIKKPNVVGKDLFFMYYVVKSKQIQMLWAKNSHTREVLLTKCAKGAGTIDNRSCGYLIQYDGWQIKDDYPW